MNFLILISVSVSYNLFLSGVVIAAGPLLVFQQAGHLHMASPSQMCL